MENIKKILLVNTLMILGIFINMFPMQTVVAAASGDVLPGVAAPSEITDARLTSQVSPPQVDQTSYTVNTVSSSMPSKSMMVWLILTIAVLIIDIYAIFFLFKNRRKNYQDFEMML